MSRTKGSGGGSIFRYPNGWRGQITLGNKRVSFTGRTKKEVIDKITAARVDYDRGQFIFTNDVTVKEWATNYLERKIRPNIKPQSYDNLKVRYYKDLIPQLGHYKLQALTTDILQDFYDVTYKDKSISTARALLTSFNQCLELAVDQNIITRNPQKEVKLTTVRPSKKISAYSVEDHKKIVELCKSDKRFYIFYLLISTGMRVGEAIALTWDDIDFKERTIRIDKTMIKIGNITSIQYSTKTEKGSRTIVISDSLIEILRTMYGQNDSDLNRFNMLFYTSTGNHLQMSEPQRRWLMLIDRLKIDNQGIHALRHTWATRALEVGVDVKTVSTMLGHTNVATTMNVYQDVLKDHQHKAVQLMQNLF